MHEDIAGDLVDVQAEIKSLYDKLQDSESKPEPPCQRRILLSQKTIYRRVRGTKTTTH